MARNGELDKRHKEEVERLSQLEDRLADRIGATNNTYLMNLFTDWQEQRLKCNETYNEMLSGILDDATKKTDKTRK